MAATVRAPNIHALTEFLLSTTCADVDLELDGTFSNISLLDGIRCSFALASNASIKTLSIKVLCADLDDAIITVLLEAIVHSKLKAFTLDASLHVFSSHPSVLLSEASGMAIANAITMSTSLTSVTLDVSKTRLDDSSGVAIADAIRANSTLETFELLAYETRMSDTTGAAFAAAIEANQTLWSFMFRVSDTAPMGDVSGVALANAVFANRALWSLYITMSARMGDATVLAFAEAIKANTTLTLVEVGAWMSDEWTDASVVALAGAIEANTTLVSLYLCLGRELTDASGVAIANAIRANQTLEKFDIEMLPMGDASGAAFARAIQANTTLWHLKVDASSDPSLSDTGMVAIANAVQANRTLEFFHFNASDTHISDASGVALAGAIKANSALKSFEVDVGNTELGDVSLVAFARAIETNTSLISFSLAASNTEMGNTTAIRNALWANTTLTSTHFKLDSDLHCVNEYVARNQLLIAAAEAFKRIAPIEDSGGFDSLRQRMFRMKVMEYFLPTAAAAQVCCSIPMRSTGVAAALEFEKLDCAVEREARLHLSDFEQQTLMAAQGLLMRVASASSAPGNSCRKRRIGEVTGLISNMLKT